MAIFRRRNNQANVPEEIREYYQSERRERAGIAWLLAFGTLVVTILLAGGIFFAGRWAYRSVFNKEKNPSPQTQVAQQEQKKEEQPAQNNSSQQNQQSQQGSEQQSQSGSQGQQNQQPSNEQAQQSQPQQNPTPTPSAPTPPANSQPATGSQSGQTQGAQTGGGPLPSTGPEGIIGIFAAVSLAGYALHRLFSLTATKR